MAMLIRSTPILSGANAEYFLELIEENKSNKINFSDEIAKAKRIIEKSKAVRINLLLKPTMPLL